jgi:hypothetical protein
MKNPVERAAERKSALWTEMSTWREHWREISTYQMPRTGRYVASGTNKGGKKHNSIFDNTAMFGIRTLESGLMSGMTSPARPWFRMTIRDKQLAERARVKKWLHDCAEMLRAIFSASNTYRALHQMYGELGAFGTAASIVLPDFENVIHHYPLTIGSYALGTNYKGEVDTLVREFELTVWQMVDEFGLENCSQTVQNLWASEAYDKRVEVHHIIQPRRMRDASKSDAKNMPWASCYYEKSETGAGKWLRESGFKRFPVLAPRWAVTPDDVYGYSPGMECLGDVKQLQHQQLRKAQAIDYQTNPPIVVPSTYKEDASARLPGGVFHVDMAGPGNAVRSAFDVNLNLQHLREDMQEVRDRIRGAYYADLFLMWQHDRRANVTATEVAEKHEEKLLMLGPVLERLHNELLSPMIDLAFDYAWEAGILPPVPPELADQGDIQVEFISTLAQAQRMVAAGGADRLINTASAMVQLWPEVRHKINAAQAIDDYADMFGVNPELVNDDEVVAERMEAEAQAAAQAQAAAAAPVAADAAKTMGDVNVRGLRDVMSMFTGYNSP